MMGGRRAGLKPRSTYPSAINNFYNLEQGRVVNIFGTNYLSCTVTPNISSYGERVDGLGHISNSTIATDRIS